MNTKITFVELVDLMAQSTSTSKRVSELFLRELFGTVSQALIDGENVKIKGIGTFKLTKVKPRKSVDVSTGSAIEISSYTKLTFTPDKSLAEAVNQPFAQFETVVLDDAVTDKALAAIDKQYPSLFAELPNEQPSREPVTESTPAIESKPAPVNAPEPVPEPEPAPVPEPEPAPVLEPESASEPETEPVPVPEPAPAPVLETKPVEEATSLQSDKPQEEEKRDEYFHRPALRNAYTPTEEQLSQRRSSGKRWLWTLPVVVLVGLLLWLFWPKAGGISTQGTSVTSAVVDSDSTVAAAEPAVITDTVTAKIVLTTLADKYYDSPWFWVYIYEENKAIIDDPNNMRPGTEVVIPPAEKYGIDASDEASVKKAQMLSWKILSGK